MTSAIPAAQLPANPTAKATNAIANQAKEQVRPVAPEERERASPVNSKGVSGEENSQFDYIGTCRIFLEKDGLVSVHAGAPMYHRLKGMVLNAVDDFAPGEGISTPDMYRLTLVSGRAFKNLAFGSTAIRDGNMIAFHDEPAADELLGDLERARQGQPLLTTEQFENTLKTFECPP